MKRLSEASLTDLPPSISQPSYVRANLGIGVVHLGIGAFHRAHQAVYLDDRLAAGERDWAICGASLRSPAVAAALQPQDCLYTVAVRSSEGIRHRVIGSVRQILDAGTQLQELLRVMTRPEVRIVSLTVTEKGYYHDPATRMLREDDPAIIADLARPQAPGTAPGLLVEALRRRREAGIKPFTVLCCDNLPANGATIARIVSRYAALHDRELGAFVAGEVAFPSTMVDRIVPATTDADRAAVAADLGLYDAWPVSTEPFTQWVIQDHFPGGRPRLEEAGAELVADVAPYELMKLRLLNGSHSTLAYLGYLAGYETIADAMASPAFSCFVTALMDEEVTPTVTVPAGADLDAYKRSLRTRFSNTALRHRTWQIAMDGSQKLPQRLLGTIHDRLRAGAPIPRLALGVAAWMRYVTGWDEKGQPIDVRDPLGGRLRALADEAGSNPEHLAQALMSVNEIFGELPTIPQFNRDVSRALAILFRLGAHAAVEEINGGAANA